MDELVQEVQEHFGEIYGGWADFDRLLFVNDEKWIVITQNEIAIPAIDTTTWAQMAFSETESRVSGWDSSWIGPLNDSIVLEVAHLDEEGPQFLLHKYYGNKLELVLNWIENNKMIDRLKETWDFSDFPLLNRMMAECCKKPDGKLLTTPELFIPEIDLRTQHIGIGLTSTSEWSLYLSLTSEEKLDLQQILESNYWNIHLELVSKTETGIQNFEIENGDEDASVILHVPHSSSLVPKHHIKKLAISGVDLGYELLQMTDSYTAEIARAAACEASVLPWIFQNNISRLVVDPERFTDEREKMESVGMGAVYKLTHNQKPLRDLTDLERNELLDTYFQPYSGALENLVEDRLKAAEKVVILDIHSYPSQKLPYEIHNGERPEICLGVDEFHTSTELFETAKDIFSRFGRVSINSPFEGTYVPLKFYEKDKRIQSIMIEIRRDVYMDELTGIPDVNQIDSLGIALGEFISKI